MGKSYIYHQILKCILLIVVCSFAGSCSKGGNPISPGVGNEELDSGISTGTDSLSGNPHQLIGYYLFLVNDEHTEIEVIPVREVADHFNVRKFLENWPCTTCISIEDFEKPEPGRLDITIQLQNPFFGTYIYGFDVRGICMFNGSVSFPASGNIFSDSDFGDGELLNAHGYTGLYNPTTFGLGPGVFTYTKGKWGTNTFPNATINGYMRHSSHTHWKTRAVFDTDIVSEVYEIKVPDGPFVFGYAVDASWAPPDNIPVENPQDDFPITANAPEPWQFDIWIDQIGHGFTPSGGSVYIDVQTFCWWEADTMFAPVIECPALWDGLATTEIWTSSDILDYHVQSYETVLNKTTDAPVGEYPAMIAVASKQNLNAPPYMDITAYWPITLTVSQGPTGLGVDITPDYLNFNPEDVFVDENYAYVAAGYNGLHIFDLSDPEHPEWLNSVKSLVPHRSDDIWRKVEVVDGIAYVSGEGHGLVLIDVDPPESAYVIKQIDLYEKPFDVDVVDGYAYVACTYLGFAIFDIDPPESAHLVSKINAPYNHYSVQVVGDYAYMTSASQPIYIIDISDKDNPFVATEFDPPGSAMESLLVGNLLFIANEYSDGLEVWDVSDPLNPVNAGGAATLGEPRDLDIYGNILCTVGMTIGTISVTRIEFFDISDPVNPVKIATHDPYFNATRVDIQDGYAYVCDEVAGILVYDYDPIESLAQIEQTNTFGSTIDIAVKDSYAFVCDDPFIKVLDIDPVADSHIVHEYETGYLNPISIDIRGDYAFVSTWNSKVLVFDISNPESIYIYSYLDSWNEGEDLGVTDDGYLFVGEGGAPYPAVTLCDIDPIDSAYTIDSYGGSGWSFGNMEICGDVLTMSKVWGGGKGGLVYDISDAENWDNGWITGVFNTSGMHLGGICVHGNTVCADGRGNEDDWGGFRRFATVDITDHDNPVQYDIDIPYDSLAYKMISDGTYCYSANQHDGVVIYDISDVTNPSIADHIYTAGRAMALEIVGNMLYVADGPGGVKIIEIQ